jgi:hypothetical protein
MATKTPKGKKVKAGKPKTEKAAKAVKAPKEPKPMSSRQVAFQAKHKDVTVAAKGVKMLEHNHGLYFVMRGKNDYVVGRMSASGKSFKPEFEGDHDEALEFYRNERSGSYGKDKPAKAKKTAKGDDDDLEDLVD